MIGKTGIDIFHGGRISIRGEQEQSGEKSGQGVLGGILCVKEKTTIAKKIVKELIQNSAWLAVAKVYVGKQKSDFGLQRGGGDTVHRGILEFVLFYIHKV